MSNRLTVYKLTDANARTHGGTQWTPGEWREAPGEGPLCTAGWLHYYEDPLLAAFLYPLHVSYPVMRLWEAEADGAILRDGDLKAGASRLRVVREIERPALTLPQRVAFAIFCAWETSSESWRTWAREWLSGENRSRDAAARSAAYAAAADAAAYASADAYALFPGELLHHTFRALEVV